MELAKQHPQLLKDLVGQRPLQRLLERDQLSRLDSQRALADEQLQLMELNEKRLASYSKAARDWSNNWPTIQKQIRSLPLHQAHEVLIREAVKYLPTEV